MPGESDLRKFAETTELRDTPENRALLGKQAAIIGAEIRAGTFDYARWFPGGNRVRAIQLQVTSAESPKRGHDRPILSQLDRTKTPTAGTSFPRP
jgi:hypothetical protein